MRSILSLIRGQTSSILYEESVIIMGLSLIVVLVHVICHVTEVASSYNDSTDHYIMTDAHLTDVPDDIPNAAVIIDISRNDITTFTDFPEFPMLKKLLIIRNSFTDFPNLDPVSTTLVYLDISRNDISLISNKNIDLPVLNTLIMNYNGILLFPNLTSMGSLKKLKLSNNNISHIPDNLFSPLINLQLLDMSNNVITTIPDLSMPHLTSLLLRGNPLMEIVPVTPQLGHTLNVLSLGDAQMHHIALESLQAVPRLTHLTIRNVSLTSVPPVMEATPLLKVLDLSYNKITSLPGGLFEVLEHLHYIDMRRNLLITFLDVCPLSTVSVTLR